MIIIILVHTIDVDYQVLECVMCPQFQIPIPPELDDDPYYSTADMHTISR